MPRGQSSGHRALALCLPHIPARREQKSQFLAVWTFTTGNSRHISMYSIISILLSGFWEGMGSFLIVIIFVGGIFYIFQWIMAKYFGTHYHGKFQAGDAYQKTIMWESQYNLLAETHPELIQEAINRCKRKGYTLTHFNILIEADSVEKECRNEPQLKDKVINKLRSIADLMKSDNTDSKIDKLEKLNRLFKDGVISEDEKEKLKSKILK